MFMCKSGVCLEIKKKKSDVALWVNARLLCEGKGFDPLSAAFFFFLR